ncbi:hypothetical protein LCGC14_3057470, partial [marine sediment metagenome]
RDAELSAMYPTLIRPRPRPSTIPKIELRREQSSGEFLIQDVYEGLPQSMHGQARYLRVVEAHERHIHTSPCNIWVGMGGFETKTVLGCVPIESDGSAYFRVPSGVTFFLQALDEEGMAVQTMRSATYLQPGQTYSCIGCHEHRQTAPPNVVVTAARRRPSKITPGVEGSWPLDYQVLVQPVLEKHCVECHKAGGEYAEFDLTAASSYDSLLDYGTPSLRQHVSARYREGRSVAGACASRMNALWKLLDDGHYEVDLTADDRRRLATWMDTYGQRLGSFGEDQEQRLRELRRRMASLLAN